MAASARRLMEIEPSASDASLVNTIKRLSFIEGVQITLSSGASSNFYFDMKPTLFDPEGLSAVSTAALGVARRLNVDFVGGLELGAVPLVAGIVQASAHDGRKTLNGFFVRKEPKSHGTKRLVEGLGQGKSLQGRPILVVDDVTTSGGSVLKAVFAAREAGGLVSNVLTIVDRREGAAKNLANEGIELIALSDVRDYGIGR